MTDKTNNERMNAAHVRAAEIIMLEMEAVAGMGATLADKTDMLAKLGMTLSGLRVNPEPFDAKIFAEMLAKPYVAPAPDGGTGGNLA